MGDPKAFRKILDFSIMNGTPMYLLAVISLICAFGKLDCDYEMLAIGGLIICLLGIVIGLIFWLKLRRSKFYSSLDRGMKIFFHGNFIIFG
jgi:Ca2+/Na+ antiporter